MAPGCSAGRLSHCSVFTVCFVIYLICQEVSSLVVYDRLTLLEIGGYFDRLTYDKLISSPPCLEGIPAFLRRSPLHLVPLRRRRRRGKRGGLQVRLKAHLRSIVCLIASEACTFWTFRGGRDTDGSDQCSRTTAAVTASAVRWAPISCCCLPPAGVFLPGDAV